MAPEDHLADLLAGVADGHPPPPDGGITVLSPGAGRTAGILAFAAHHVVAADVEASWVHEQLPGDDLSAPLAPPFVSALAARLGRRIGTLDIVLVAGAADGPAPIELVPGDERAHPRVDRAHRYRTDVRLWDAAGGDGLLVLGRGLAGRWEVALEVEPAARGRGLGRALFAAARHLVPAGERVWAQVAPGNVPSVRAVLASGYVPVGAEVLFAAR